MLLDEESVSRVTTSTNFQRDPSHIRKKVFFSESTVIYLASWKDFKITRSQDTAGLFNSFFCSFNFYYLFLRTLAIVFVVRSKRIQITRRKDANRILKFSTESEGCISASASDSKSNIEKCAEVAAVSLRLMYLISGRGLTSLAHAGFGAEQLPSYFGLHRLRLAEANCRRFLLRAEEPSIRWNPLPACWMDYCI